MNDHAMTLMEKILAIPPATVLITSLLGWVNWQSAFYFVSFVWVLVQLAFRLRKEWLLRHEAPKAE